MGIVVVAEEEVCVTSVEKILISQGNVAKTVDMARVLWWEIWLHDKGGVGGGNDIYIKKFNVTNASSPNLLQPPRPQPPPPPSLINNNYHRC